MISKHLRVFLLGLVLAGEGGLSRATPMPEPPPALLARIEKLRAREMGVDRAGSLWAWGSGLGGVTLISPAGVDLGFLKASGAQTVDVDGEWGVVGLFHEGYELQWLKDDGEPRVAIRLAGPASDVCWVGPGLVAITPQMAGHRIEIWDLKKKILVKTLGEETPLHPVPGATRMRAVLLRYDFAQGLLYSLESFTGDLQVFDKEERLAWRASVDNPRRPEFEKWLQGVDATSKAQRDVQTPVIFALRLALSSQGNVWVLQSRDKERHAGTFLQIGPKERSVHIVPEGTCPGDNFLIWKSQLVTFREPSSPQGACVGWIPVP